MADVKHYWHEVDLSTWRKHQEGNDRYLPFTQYRRMLRETEFTYPSSADNQPRGIVTCAGGGHLPGAWVLINRLRELGCTLPIEVWHLGPDDLRTVWSHLFAQSGATTIDAFAFRPAHPAHKLMGWSLKTYAMALSKFDEVLFLDADNIPRRDPTFLFDTPLYKQTGALFWPDRQRHDATHPLWRIFNVPYRDEPAHETGQMVLDTKRHWNILQVALHCNIFADFYYRFSYGDTALLRFAFHEAHRPFSMILHRLLELPTEREADSIETLKGAPYLRVEGDIRAAFLQRDPDGECLFEHRCAAKLKLDDNIHLAHCPNQPRYWALLDELRDKLLAVGEPWEVLAQSDPEKVSPHRREGMCLLFQEMSKRKANSIVETGTLRQENNWHGDGGLTWFFARYLSFHHGRLWTVDNSEAALAVSRKVTERFKEHIEYVHSDSVAWLRARTEPIDVLFLDSVGYEGGPECERAAQEHNLAEVMAAMPKLHERSLIAIDDCGLPNGGKGGMSVPYLLNHGWERIGNGYMAILRRK